MATIRAVRRFGAEALSSVYASLSERGTRQWIGVVGKVPPIFIDAVAKARAALQAETEDELRPYWQQRLARTETELREQEERAKERRGE